jgi:hypothetical protein
MGNGMFDANSALDVWGNQHFCYQGPFAIKRRDLNILAIKHPMLIVTYSMFYNVANDLAVTIRGRLKAWVVIRIAELITFNLLFIR